MKNLLLLPLLLLLGAHTTYAQTEFLITGKTPLLYVNCKNTIHVTSPQINSISKYTLKCEGGIAWFDSTHIGDIHIVPNAIQPNVLVKIYQKESLVAQKTFNLTIFRDLHYTFKIDDIPVDTVTGFSLSHVKVFSVTLTDSIFCATLPNDCNFSVKEWEIKIMRGDKIIYENVYDTEAVLTKPFFNLIKRGDIIVIKINKAMRMNYRGRYEDLRVGYQGRNIIHIPVK